MNTKYLSTKYYSIFFVVVLLLIVFLSTAHANPDSQYLINDHFDIDFDGDGQDDLDTTVWEFRTHVPNIKARYEMGNNSIINIHSGELSGSGGSIRTLNEFNPGDGVLIFETRAYESFDDGGWWGFFGDNHDGVVVIGLDTDGVLRIEVMESNTVSATHVRFEELNYSAL